MAARWCSAEAGESLSAKAIFNTGIQYGILKRHGDRAQDHRRGAARTPRKGATGQRQRHHPDRLHRPATGCGVACLRAPAPTARQGSFHPHGSRAEGRSMIAVDTSTWIGFLEGDGGQDADLLDSALQDRQVLMVPVVLTEMLSDPKLPSEVSQTLSELPLIEVEPGYWQRAGELRAKVLAKRRKARLGDALIAQSCIDRGIPLITRDRDFRAFAEAAGLDLPIGSAAD